MRTIDHSGKTVVITGAGSGIGRASAEAFADCGACVVVNDIDETRARETVARIRDAGGEASAFAADVTDAERVEALVLYGCERYGAVDIMFNNAGGAFPTPLLDVGPEEHRRIMALNSESAYYGTRAALQVMLPRRSGVILTTTSGAGINAMPGLASYGMAKAAVIALMKSVAVEYGRMGIRANTLSPGAMETPGLTAWIQTLPGGPDAYRDAQPQGRLGTAEEVADAAVYLASDHASFINGAMLAVDGGVHASLWNPLSPSG